MDAPELEKKNLPHLYGQKMYKWQRNFYDTKNKVNLLFCANQCGKSSIQIRKVIDMATNKEKWPEWWPSHPVPGIFWYFYPDAATANVEFTHKWEKEFLPRGPMKEDSVYGWELEKPITEGKFPTLIFKSGVTVYFKGYSQNVFSVQASTLHLIATDEELPAGFFNELLFRLFAVDGYFSMVCTATRGQLFWKNSIEPRSKQLETLPSAHKQQISMYQCLEFEDGDKKTPITLEKIKRVEESCTSSHQIAVRVHGKFSRDANIVYDGFDPKVSLVRPYDINSWSIFAGIDVSPKEKGHPPAIVYVAIRPDYKKAAVFKGWCPRGAGQVFSNTDIILENRSMRKEIKKVTQCSVSEEAEDFINTSNTLGESFTPVNKSLTLGQSLINNLFKSGMLDIFDIPELHGLVDELTSFEPGSTKKEAVDDFIDALRAAISMIPFDFSDQLENLATRDELNRKEERKNENKKRYQRDRDELLAEIHANEGEGQDNAVAEWAELYD